MQEDELERSNARGTDVEKKIIGKAFCPGFESCTMHNDPGERRGDDIPLKNSIQTIPEKYYFVWVFKWQIRGYII